MMLDGFINVHNTNWKLGGPYFALDPLNRRHPDPSGIGGLSNSTSHNGWQLPWPRWRDVHATRHGECSSWFEVARSGTLVKVEIINNMNKYIYIYTYTYPHPHLGAWYTFMFLSWCPQNSKLKLNWPSSAIRIASLYPCGRKLWGAMGVWWRIAPTNLNPGFWLIFFKQSNRAMEHLHLDGRINYTWALFSCIFRG